MTVRALSDKDFDEAIRGGIVLVDFWAPWCAPCLAFAAIFEAASEQHPDIRFCKVNTEEEPDLAEGNGISSIPTLMAFRDGILVFEQAGILPAHSIDNLVREAKALDMDKIQAELASRAKPAVET